MTRLLLVLLLMTSAAYGQALSYADADTPSEAVGMMNTTIVTSRKMLSECTSRFPTHQEEMYKNLRRWEETEHAVILKTGYFWGQMAKRNRKLVEFNDYVEALVVRNLDNVANAPAREGASVAATYCRQHFADLASGVWRIRTPRAYKYLDEAPASTDTRAVMPNKPFHLTAGLAPCGRSVRRR